MSLPRTSLKHIPFTPRENQIYLFGVALGAELSALVAIVAILLILW